MIAPRLTFALLLTTLGLGALPAAMPPTELPSALSLYRPIKVGMTMEQVTAEWGRPESIDKLKTPYHDNEIMQWTYSRVVDTTTKPMEIRMVDQPAFDPLNNESGFLKTIQTPSITHVTIDEVSGVQLVFRDGILAGSKPFKTQRQRFAN